MAKLISCKKDRLFSGAFSAIGMVLLGGAVIYPADARADELQDIPLSVSAITLSETQLLNPDPLEELKNLPGVSTRTITDFGGGYATGYLIRGLDPKNPVVMGMGNNTGRFTSQIEVLPGPQGSLFGRNSVQFFGQSNSAYINVDNGNPAGDNSGFSSGPNSFVGLEATAGGGDYLAGVRFAGAWGINQRNFQNDFIDSGCNADDPDQNLCLYDLHAYIASVDHGRLTAGIGETAFHGIADINLSGIGHVLNADPAYYIGRHEVFGAGTTWEDAFGFPGGVERGFSLRYDTPTFAGFILSASFGEANGVDAPRDAEGYYDVALRYAGEFGAYRAAAGVGYQEFDIDWPGNLQQSNLSGSVSISHTPTGLFLGGSYTASERDADTPVLPGQTTESSQYSVHGGIRTPLFEIGDTIAFAMFTSGNDTGPSGNYFDEGSSFEHRGVGVAQEIDQLGTTLSIFYGTYGWDSGVFPEIDADVVVVSSRFKF